MSKWVSTKDQLPERDVVVLTKVDDDKGERNVCDLSLDSNGMIWWTSSGMYVYYTPTHWRYLNKYEVTEQE